MSMSMWASTSAEESNPAWLATQLGFISPSKPCFRLYIACIASSKPCFRLYIACIASSKPCFRLYIVCSAPLKPCFRLYTLAVHRRSLVFDYTSLAVLRRSLVCDYTLLAVHRRSLVFDYTSLAVHRRSLFCDYNVHSYPVGNGAFASIFCYGCSSHRESITKPSCSISSSSASPQKLFCGLASPSSMLCEVTINPKTECSVIGESTSVFGEMYVRFIFSIYKNYFTNTLRPFMI